MRFTQNISQQHFQRRKTEFEALRQVGHATVLTLRETTLVPISTKSNESNSVVGSQK